MPEPFAGDKKHGHSLLHPLEQRLRDLLVPLVPPGIQTYHLTLASLPISALVVVVGYLARQDIRWLWLTSALIVLQYITDLLDGEIGRRRKTGLIRWGYYMDHLFDYIFLCALLIGYVFITPEEYRLTQFFILALFGAFMASSYLEFAASNRFRIAHLGIGPTEVRIGFIAVNTLLIIVGKTYLAPLTPYVLGAAFIGLTVVAYFTARRLWALDMDEKQRHT